MISLKSILWRLFQLLHITRFSTQKNLMLMDCKILKTGEMFYYKFTRFMIAIMRDNLFKCLILTMLIKPQMIHIRLL